MSANKPWPSLLESIDVVIRYVDEYDSKSDNIVAASRSQPKIKTFQWGIIDIEYDGETKTYKDAIIKPDGAIEWNWKLDGTRHNPGITIAAVENNRLYEKADIVILSRGVNKVLQTKKETERYVGELKEDGQIDDFMILQSNEAVKKYEELVESGKKVSVLLHSTC